MRTLICTLLALLPSVAFALSPPRGGATFGLGVGGGYGVSGLSGKYWFGNNALQMMIGTYGGGFYYGHYGYFGREVGIGVDYLWEMPDIANGGPVVFGWNLGAGASVGLGDAMFLGVSGVAGFEFDFQPVPIDLVLEYRPGFYFVPGLAFDAWNFGAHLRVYFM